MKLVQKLNDIAAQIRKLESEAAIALYENSDKNSYSEKLAKKAEILVELPTMCEELTKDLSPEILSFIQDILGGISFSAGKALHLNSIFYMSALLYPEGYKDGDNNDLEDFIEKLQYLQNSYVLQN